MGRVAAVVVVVATMGVEEEEVVVVVAEEGGEVATVVDEGEVMLVLEAEVAHGTETAIITTTTPSTIEGIETQEPEEEVVVGVGMVDFNQNGTTTTTTVLHFGNDLLRKSPTSQTSSLPLLPGGN